ncbi:hypothetical protein C8Q77DRAFT_312710 [Trametes polyzona]|nr:hypothetical protein C8Q77DRAFT_312710 [Trametes polyzona]
MMDARLQVTASYATRPRGTARLSLRLSQCLSLAGRLPQHSSHPPCSLSQLQPDDVSIRPSPQPRSKHIHVSRVQRSTTCTHEPRPSAPASGRPMVIGLPRHRPRPPCAREASSKKHASGTRAGHPSPPHPILHVRAFSPLPPPSFPASTSRGRRSAPRSTHARSQPASR